MYFYPLPNTIFFNSVGHSLLYFCKYWGLLICKDMFSSRLEDILSNNIKKYIKLSCEISII